MTERTLLVSASLVTQGFMQREVTDGTEERVTRMSKDETYRNFTENQFYYVFDRNDTRRGRGGQNL